MPLGAWEEVYPSVPCPHNRAQTSTAPTHHLSDITIAVAVMCAAMSQDVVVVVATAGGMSAVWVGLRG